MRIGKTDFNEEGLATLTKEEFIDTYRGKLGVDIEQTAKKLEKYFKRNVSEDKKTSRKRKRVKIKGSISDSISE